MAMHCCHTKWKQTQVEKERKFKNIQGPFLVNSFGWDASYNQNENRDTAYQHDFVLFQSDILSIDGIYNEKYSTNNEQEPRPETLIVSSGELRTGTRVSRAKFVQYLEWYISVSKVAARVETVLVYHHTFLYYVIKFDHAHPFIAGIWLLHRSTSGSIKRKRRLFKPQLFPTIPRFSKTR